MNSLNYGDILMKNTKTVEQLKQVLADGYTLFIKLQNYHWHVKGPRFKSLHELFEEQYQELWPNLDEIAERIVTLGGKAPGTMKEFLDLTGIEEQSADKDGEAMIADLNKSHGVVVAGLKELQRVAADEGDASTEDLAIGRIFAHEKFQWMLRSHLE